MRTEKFPPDQKRILVTAAEVIAAWKAHSTVIPAQYACGTAQHETNYTLNEVDTEDSGFVSLGIFQLSAEECKEANQAGIDLLNLDNSCIVLALIARRRLDVILSHAGIDPTGPLPADVWAYLALAHNQGLGACLKTISAHGLDWAGYKTRNPQLGNMLHYGDDCISGGEKWILT